MVDFLVQCTNSAMLESQNIDLITSCPLLQEVLKKFQDLAVAKIGHKLTHIHKLIAITLCLRARVNNDV